MKKGKGTETRLPEAIIHHIQSYMNGKEAVRTTLISKSWHNAWLTRPSIDLDELIFNPCRRNTLHDDDEFPKYVVQRYKDSKLKIDSFKLLIIAPFHATPNSPHHLIAGALEIGATNLHLDFAYSLSSSLPKQLLSSQTLTTLSLHTCKLDPNHAIRCSSLKSLALKDVEFTSDDLFKDIITCCCDSLEELSLSKCSGMRALSPMNLYQLHKLRLLSLCSMDILNTFYTEFASRFPCLKDLSISILCRVNTRIEIASTSLETITLKASTRSWGAKFDVPNIRRFTYAGSVLPCRLFINGASREWELDISITCNSSLQKPLWFINLKRVLERFRLSRITSLSIHVGYRKRQREVGVGVEDEVIVSPPPPDAVVVENLTIYGESSCYWGVLVRLFGICRPRFIIHDWVARRGERYRCRMHNASIEIVCKRLMQLQEVVIPYCCSIDENMFGVKKVKVEGYEMIDRVWRPWTLLEKTIDAAEAPLNKRKIRFELMY